MRLKNFILLIICVLVTCSNAHSEISTTKTIVLSVPHLKWALEIDAPNFIVEQEEITPSGDNARFFATNKETGVVMSGFLERVSRSGTSKDCRDYYWERAKKSPFKKDDIKMSDFGPMALMEYIVKEHRGKVINQKHLNAYLAKDNYCIDIHLSKVNFRRGDEQLFEAILKTVRINETWREQRTERHYRIPSHGVLTMSVPISWHSETRQPPNDLPPTIAFRPEAGKYFEILITVIWSPGQKPNFNSPEEIRKIVEKSGNEILHTGVETELNLHELKGSDTSGYYYTLTDKAPKPGEFEYVTQGDLGVGDLLLIFTILTHAKESEIIKDVLEMLINTKQYK